MRPLHPCRPPLLLVSVLLVLVLGTPSEHSTAGHAGGGGGTRLDKTGSRGRSGGGVISAHEHTRVYGHLYENSSVADM